MNHPNEMTHKELDDLLYPDRHNWLSEGISPSTIHRLLGQSREKKSESLLRLLGVDDSASFDFFVAKAISDGILKMQVKIKQE